MKQSFSRYLFHKSSIANRNSIRNNGLIPQVGSSYQSHWDTKKDLKPLVFMYDATVCEYDTTYDDDIYRIDIEKLDKRKITFDPDRSMIGCYVYSAVIPNNCCSIVYYGTGRDKIN